MKKNIVLSLLVIFVFVWQKVHSNGGPLDDKTINTLGRHNFKNVETIQLVNENLDIRILGEFVEYQVEYEFINKGKDTIVDYGFPVEFYNGWQHEKEKPDVRDIISLFQLQDSGTIIPFESSLEKIRSGGEGDSYWNIWYRTKLSFKENERKKLRIKYILKSANDDMIYTKSFIPRYSLRTTNYNFKGAKYWGDGKIESVNIRIDGSALEETGGLITAVEPEGYAKNRNIYNRSYKNIAVEKIPNLLVKYSNTNAVFSNYVIKERVPREEVEYIRATSTLEDKESGNKRYSVENLLDGAYDTAWAAWEQGSRKITFIDVKLEKPYHVIGIGILNGYLKSENTFNENGRVKSLFISAMQTYTGLTENGARVEKIDNLYYKMGDNKYVKLEAKKFKDFNPKDTGSFIDWIEDYGESYEKTIMLHIEIDEAEPGSKYTQMAISELYILGWPAKDNEGE